MRRAGSFLVLVPVLLALSACGNAVAPSAGSGRSATPSVPTDGAKHVGVGLVLEDASHGPQLCFGWNQSLPPKCSGVDLTGWDWATAEDRESANGASWGMYAVTGVWDGERLAVTDVGPPTYPGHPADDPDLMTPCDPPAGGWAVVDEATATDEALAAVRSYVTTQPDYAGRWIDQSINPADGGENVEEEMNDPTLYILNVMFTGDLERHEADIRALWGGSLCVSEAPRSEAELSAIQAEMNEEAGILASWTNDRAGTVEVSVVLDNGLQQRMDEKYGDGVVVVTPSLLPAE